MHPCEILHLPERTFQNALVQKDQHVQRLSLGGSGHSASVGQMVEERFNILRTEFARMLLMMKQDELPTPVSISLDRAIAEMPTAADDRELIEQAWGTDGRFGTQTWSLLM